MKRKLIFGITIISVLMSSISNAGTIADDYDAANTTLTATMMNNIKAAVNDNDSNISTNSSDITNNTNSIAGLVSSGIATSEITSQSLAVGYADVLSLTFTAPAAGYVHVTATGMIQLSNKTNVSSSDFASVYVGISQISSSVPFGSNFTRFFRSGTSGTGSYEIPYSIQGVFTVTAGTNTFYIVGRENGGSGSATLYHNRLVASFHATTM